MVELVYAAHLKRAAFGYMGSNPIRGTKMANDGRKRSDFVKAIQQTPIRLKLTKNAGIKFEPIDREKYEITEELKQRRHDI